MVKQDICNKYLFYRWWKCIFLCQVCRGNVFIACCSRNALDSNFKFYNVQILDRIKPLKNYFLMFILDCYTFCNLRLNKSFSILVIFIKWALPAVYNPHAISYTHRKLIIFCTKQYTFSSYIYNALTSGST